MIAGTSFEIVEVSDVWACIAKRAERGRTAPEVLDDIQARCRTGDALCLAGPDGVVVLVIEPTELGNASGRVTLMVLLAVSSGLHGAFERQESAMLAIARDIGATELAFRTERRGWRRLVGPQWHVHGDRFTRLV